MQFKRMNTIKYITDMAGQLQKMAEVSDTPVLSHLLKMAQLEGKNTLKNEKIKECHTSEKMKESI